MANDQPATNPPATPPDDRKLTLVTPEQLAAEAAKTPPPIGEAMPAPEQPPLVEDLVPLSQLLELHLAPVARKDEELTLGVTPAVNIAQLPPFIRQFPKVQFKFVQFTEDDFNLVYNRLYLLPFKPAVGGDYTDFEKTIGTIPPKRAFELIAQLAYLMEASDIHIEPQAQITRIRFRLDGVLHPICTVNSEAYKIFLSDLQSKAGLKWGSDVPQNGRITYTVVKPDGHTLALNMRIETIPAFHGEEIVVRLFNQDPELLKLSHMGYTHEQIKTLENQVTHFAGLVLITGPTGSGKTSALYSVINKLNDLEHKIITLEDPVEYDLPGISQISVHTEETDSFADKLRAVLREDPNVIMVGEIRDADTARSALQAALTGHLVLSTFHANDSASAIARLEDMIGENPLLASAIKLIMSQRLVRKVCPYCKESYQPTKTELAFIKDTIDSLPEKQQPDYAKLKLQRGKGCPQCHGIGYLGRSVIAEQLVVTPTIQELMSSNLKSVAQQVHEESVRSGMITLLQDGVLKAVAGITTLDEVSALR